MSADLKAIWTILNVDLFRGRLHRPAAIEYEVTSGPQGIAAHGIYLDKSRAVVIDQKFQFDSARHDQGRVGQEADVRRAERRLGSRGSIEGWTC